MTNHPNRNRRLRPIIDDQFIRRLAVGLPRRRSLDGVYCRECGGSMFIGEAGASHHGSPSDISYDDDADHVAVVEEEPE